MARRARDVPGNDSPVQADAGNVQVVFFAPSLDAGTRWINGLINEYTALSGIEIYRTIESLTKRLCRPCNCTLIAVLFATRRETLSSLIRIQDLLFQARIILVLPDRQPETVTRGHGLRPRYLAFDDTELAEIASVLDTMIAKIPAAGGD